MDLLSSKLNDKTTKVTIHNYADSHTTNHILLSDDLKLLLLNKKKLAKKDLCCEDTANLLESVGVYKYCGTIEDRRCNPTCSSFDEVQSKLISSV
ncbi:hypothetical protein CWI39_2689p0010 [Hamiltosporidium magnivora]|uniref:Uncharacterized protein n=1 Tax=Hamiltosporidium magnivora TaxID=148818 RepID=A0A4Q9KSW6_9MICR|nr:hypothetical protein CWI39_2689p0010 [Hamiltosporidium magnivora]